MAQVNTGLGWSANGDYLLSAAGGIGAIRSTVGKHPPYSISGTGFSLSYNLYNNVYLAYSYTVDNAHIELPDVVFAVAGNNLYAFTTDLNAVISGYKAFTLYRYDSVNGYRSFVGEQGPTIWREISGGGGYYWSTTIAWASTVTWIDAGVYSTMSDAINAVFSSNTFYKLNTGFAVTCWAKWRDFVPSTYWTPFLISTDENAVKFSLDGTTETASTTAIRRYEGLTFFVSYIRGDNGEPQTSFPAFDANAEFVGPGSEAISLNNVFDLIASAEHADILVNETVDPYEDFGYTEEDAGEINPDPQDDDIDFDDLPTKSFATAGFCRIFNPDVSDLNDLASYMWTDQNFLQTVINHLKQILENPIEAIISLSMVPVQPPVGSSKVPVNVMFINTGVSMRPVTSQFVTVDCGTTVLQECYGGALDYNPYTRVQIYLPYIGIVQLDTDEVMAKTLHLQYHIDVVTGICCAEIKADNKLLYSFSGHCAVSQPITSADFSSYLNAAVAAAKVAVGVATGMASTTAGAAAAELPPAVPSKAQTSSALVPLQSSGAIGPHLGSPGLSGSHGWTDFSDIPEPQSSGGTTWGELAKPGNVNTVASAMGGKMVVQHSGGFSGNSGYLAKRRPYLIIIRPRIANPRNYAQHFGRTSMEYLNLGSCTGYTKVQSVHLSGFDATNPELSEISSLLKGGVLM